MVPGSQWRKLFLALVIILVATLSFGIGRLTGGEEREGIKIENDTQSATVINAVVPAPRSLGEVVASKNGTKYHFSYCPGAKQIKEGNRISFNSATEAEASGYTLASNCSPR